MTTFTMQELNKIEVTKEEEEAMSRVPVLNISDGGRTVQYTTPTMGEPLPNQTPDISTIITNICTQLQLLSTVIKEGAGKGNSLNAEDQSLQDCVSATLEQAEWFKEMVEDGVTQLVEDMDHTYGIESAVDSYFTNEFSLDDHVDIAAEVESKLEDIVERMVEDKLQEVVEDKLREASIRINF